MEQISSVQSKIQTVKKLAIIIFVMELIGLIGYLVTFLTSFIDISNIKEEMLKTLPDTPQREFAIRSAEAIRTLPFRTTAVITIILIGILCYLWWNVRRDAGRNVLPNFSAYYLKIVIVLFGVSLDFAWHFIFGLPFSGLGIITVNIIPMVMYIGAFMAQRSWQASLEEGQGELDG